MGAAERGVFRSSGFSTGEPAMGSNQSAPAPRLSMAPWLSVALGIGGLALLALTVAIVLTDRAVAPSVESTADSRGPEQAPRRHFRIERPASLGDAEALSIYDWLREEMVAGYRLSRNPAAAAYVTWQSYNKAPYRSATHGQRYVNNYANTEGRAYGSFEEAGRLPLGSVLAKDSFAVTSSGEVFAGPLFLMEKMPSGFSPDGNDWRYTMIMPDGSLFGTTGGQGAERVAFCAHCHKAAGDGSDHLFFVPQEYRRRVSKRDPGAR